MSTVRVLVARDDEEPRTLFELEDPCLAELARAFLRLAGNAVRRAETKSEFLALIAENEFPHYGEGQL